MKTPTQYPAMKQRISIHGPVTSTTRKPTSESGNIAKRKNREADRQSEFVSTGVTVVRRLSGDPVPNADRPNGPSCAHVNLGRGERHTHKAVLLFTHADWKPGRRGRFRRRNVTKDPSFVPLHCLSAPSYSQGWLKLVCLPSTLLVTRRNGSRHGTPTTWSEFSRITRTTWNLPN